MKIGDKVRLCISSSATKEGYGRCCEEEKEVRTGTVCYVHPEGRFFTVQFQLPCGVIRECYTGGGHE